MLFNTYLRNILVVLLLSVAAGRLMAQQEPQFTHNMFNNAFVNAGSYGMGEGVSVTGILREQWLGFKDEEGNRVSPQTYLITADAPVKFLHGGLGVGVSQDKYGFFKDMAVRLGYTYHLNLGGSTLGIGANANFNNKTVDPTKFVTVDPNDQVLSSLSAEGSMITDMSAGFYLRSTKSYIGLSTTQLLETSKALSKDGKIAAWKNRRHYYLNAGRSFTMPRFQGYEFVPSVFVKSDGNTLQVDFNAMVRYNNKVWGGATYRLNDAVALMAGVAFNDILIGYSYDIPTTRVGATGSHEVMVRYVFRIEREKPRTGYRNTRYL